MTSSIQQHAEDYLAHLQEAVTNLPVELIDEVVTVLLESAHRGRKVFIFGNGGSRSPGEDNS